MRKHPFIETAELIEEILANDVKIKRLNSGLLVLTATDRRRLRHEANRYRLLAASDPVPGGYPPIIHDKTGKVVDVG